jgi:S-adenosylmethionine-diacylglycerol 3-amino-3-carboxypropyl transferase
VTPRPSELAAEVRWSKDRIVFSACNEDTRSEVRALRPSAARRLVCVTAGGGRVLSLLAERPDEILAIDLNPCQNFLLELKIAAIRMLGHGAFLELMGVRPCTARLAHYGRVRPALSAAARRFFDDRAHELAPGVLYAGALERFFARIALVMRLVRPSTLGRLFACRDLGEQQRVLARFETPLFRLVGENLARRSVMRLFSGDPGYYRHLPDDFPIHSAVYECVSRYMWNHLVRANPLLSLVFFGRYVDETAMPAYLHASGFAKVQSSIAHVRIEIETGTVADVLAARPAGSFDAYSLSDICSYLDETSFEQLFDQVVRTARADARVCSRGCLAHPRLAPGVSRRFRRDRALENRLGFHDHAMVHRFLVAEVA